MVALVTLGSGLQALAGHRAELLNKTFGLGDPIKRLGISVDGLPKVVQLIRGGIVQAAGGHALAARLQGDEIAQQVGSLPATAPDQGAEIGLVGRLVLGKAHVAIDARQAVFGGQVLQVVAETQTVDELIDEGLEGGTGGIVGGAVGVEPRPVVVEAEVV